MILKGCLYILNFLHDVSTEIETFTKKMELASTIWEAFKTLGIGVWGRRGQGEKVFPSQKDYQRATRDSLKYGIYFSQAVNHITAAIHLEHSFGKKDFLSAF